MFEDSTTGLIAAKRANMKIVVLSTESEFIAGKYELADLKLI